MCILRRSIASLTLLAVLTGCQSSNWLKRPGLEQPPSQSVLPSEPAKPLTAGQKADVQITMAHSLENDGHVEDARQIYESIIKKNPKSAVAYHRLALSYDKQGESRKAEEYYKSALERDPKNAEILCDLGYSYYVQRRWAESESRLKQALANSPHLSRAHNNMGLVMAHTERTDAALAAFTKAGCKQADAHINLAYCLFWEQQREPAEKQFQLALKADPNSKEAKAGLAQLHNFGRPPENAVSAVKPPIPEKVASSRTVTAPEEVVRDHRTIQTSLTEGIKAEADRFHAVKSIPTDPAEPTIVMPEITTVRFASTAQTQAAVGPQPIHSEPLLAPDEVPAFYMAGDEAPLRR